MRTPLVILAMLLVTPPLALILILASALRIPDRPGGVYEWASRAWARTACRAAGVEVFLHNPERIGHREARIYIANHVSWFDIFALASVLPHYTFIAKSELMRIPVFGPAAKAAGIVFIERKNRKSAFESYREAAEQVGEGKSVVVCPEGTRGFSYALRPFKKGPFVLAISAGVPIVPCIVHGALDVMRKGSMAVHAGRVDIHLLEPVPTAGLAYEEREQLMRTVWERMAGALRDLYGIESQGSAVEREALGGAAPDAA